MIPGFASALRLPISVGSRGTGAVSILSLYDRIQLLRRKFWGNWARKLPVWVPRPNAWRWR